MRGHSASFMSAYDYTITSDAYISIAFQQETVTLGGTTLGLIVKKNKINCPCS